MRGPRNPTAGGGLAHSTPNAHPPGLSKPGSEGLPLASEDIRMMSGTMDSPSPRELGFSTQTGGDSRMGRGSKGLTAVKFPGAPLSSALGKTTLNKI